MMVRRIFIWVLFIYIGNLCVFSQDDSSWKYVREDHGIRVFTKRVAGTPINEIKVEMLMNTTLSALTALIIDVKDQPNWVYGNMEAKIIEPIDNFSWMFYGQNEAPWPVNDRDVVAKVSLYQDPKNRTVTCASSGCPDFIPDVGGFIRIPELYSCWSFIPKTYGQVLVVFVLKINLGGNIPAWLVNMTIAKGPYNTILKMSEEVEKPEYKAAHLSYILD